MVQDAYNLIGLLGAAEWTTAAVKVMVVTTTREMHVAAATPAKANCAMRAAAYAHDNTCGASDAGRAAAARPFCICTVDSQLHVCLE